MKKLKTILLTLTLLLASTGLTLCMILFIAVLARYATIFALLIILTMVGLFISGAYQVVDMIITEREGKK